MRMASDYDIGYLAVLEMNPIYPNTGLGDFEYSRDVTGVEQNNGNLGFRHDGWGVGGGIGVVEIVYYGIEEEERGEDRFFNDGRQLNCHF